MRAQIGCDQHIADRLTLWLPGAKSVTPNKRLTMSVSRYFSGILSYAVQRRISVAASASFSSSFVTSCRFWLAANSIWATLVVSACVTVAMRLRIDRSWPLIALVVFLSAGLVIRELWKSKLRINTLLILIFGATSCGFLLWPSFRGAFVSVAGDTFYYSALGQYLTDHHLGFEFGLAPIDQYANGMSEMRFSTASVLGFLSVLFRSSTAAVLPIYLFIVLANIFSGFVLLSRRFGCNRLLSLAAGLYAVIGGWVPNVVNIGGLDNLLFLSLFPFLVVRFELSRFGCKPWSTSLGFAILASSVFYAYPEGLAIAGVMFLPFFCHSLWCDMSRRRGAWRGYAISACLVVVIISPYAQGFVRYLLNEIGSGLSRINGAGIFPGLLSPRLLPAMFAFGQEYPGIMWLPHDLVLPIIMLAFIVLGSAIWMRRRKSVVLAFLLVIGMVIWQGWLQQYDYGLYKILFIGSTIWIPSLFRGGTAVADFGPRSTRPFAVTLGAIVFLSWAFAQRMEQNDKIPFRQAVPIRWYSDLANLTHKVGGRPVFLVCEDAFPEKYKDFDQEWALFFLRHVNLKIPEYFGYLGAKLYEPLMQRAKSSSEPAAFVLVNERLEGAVWSNQRFSLLELGKQPILIGVRAPNGLEHVNGKPFVWLGNDTTRFLIVSKIAQRANFSAEEFLTVPSRPEDNDRQIRISIGGDSWLTGVSGALPLQVPLKPGLNFLDIACQDSPAVSAKPDGDPRIVTLGLWDYRISSKEGESKASERQ
jgi:hypothetical protein